MRASDLFSWLGYGSDCAVSVFDEEFCDDCDWNHKPDCPTCLGTGMGSMHASRCSNCGGSGLLKSEREKEDSEMASEAKRGGDY